MGIANEGMFGPSRGKVGNLVYYIRNGKPIVRKIGRIQKEPTEAQLDNWLRMKVANAFCKAVLPFIQYGFMEQIQGKDLSQMNVGVSYNKINAIKGTYPGLSMDYPKVLLSEGPLLQADEVEVAIVPEGLKFDWYVDPQLRWPDNTDQAMLMAFFPDTNETKYKLFGAERSAGSALLELSAPLLTEYMETYIAFISADRKQVSTSVYAGAINQPINI
jgi:hypothetical protein